MPPRRSEIPSLNLSITRVVRYASGESVYGPDFATVERSTRVRRLETLARDQIIYVGGTDQVNKSLRRYLARPDKEPFTITLRQERGRRRAGDQRRLAHRRFLPGFRTALGSDRRGPLRFARSNVGAVGGRSQLNGY